VWKLIRVSEAVVLLALRRAARQPHASGTFFTAAVSRGRDAPSVLAGHPSMFGVCTAVTSWFLVKMFTKVQEALRKNL